MQTFPRLPLALSVTRNPISALLSRRVSFAWAWDGSRVRLKLSLRRYVFSPKKNPCSSAKVFLSLDLALLWLWPVHTTRTGSGRDRSLNSVYFTLILPAKLPARECSCEYVFFLPA